MSTVNRVRLATLLTLALVAGTGQAHQTHDNLQANSSLDPYPGLDETDQDYGASGTLRFRGRVYLEAEQWDLYVAWFDGTLTVSCRGLTPFATYLLYEPSTFTELAYFTADSNGSATLEVSPFIAYGYGWRWSGNRRVSAESQLVVAREVSADPYVNVLYGVIHVRVQ